MNIKFNVNFSNDPSLSRGDISLGVGEVDWAFKTELPIIESDLTAEHIDLVFDGLDTYATINLVCSLQIIANHLMK